MMFTSFGENSKIQCGDGEGREAFLPSCAIGFCVCCKISPSQPSRTLSSLYTEGPRGGREWWWGEELLQKAGIVLQCYGPGSKCCCAVSRRTHPGWARKEVQPPSLQPCFPSSLHPCFLPRAASYLERAEMASGHLHSLTHMVTQPHPVELLVVSLKIALPKTKSPLWTLFLMSQEKAAVPTFLFNTEATASLTAVY